MSRLLSIGAFVASIVGVSAAGCAANNCARAVTGTSKGTATVAAHQADCSSLLRVTVTPAASIAYETITVSPVTNTITLTQLGTTTVTAHTDFVTVTVAAGGKKRDVVAAPALPTYASACSNFAAYSSACSCWGIVPATVTASQPTITSTVTATVTPTATVTDLEMTTISQTITATATATAVQYPSLPSDVTCPRDDGQTYSFDDGKLFRIVCATDGTADDWWYNPAATNFHDCVSQCDADPTCDAAAWFAYGKQCYPATGTYELDPDSNFWIAIELGKRIQF